MLHYQPQPLHLAHGSYPLIHNLTMQASMPNLHSQSSHHLSSSHQSETQTPEKYDLAVLADIASHQYLDLANSDQGQRELDFQAQAAWTRRNSLPINPVQQVQQQQQAGGMVAQSVLELFTTPPTNPQPYYLDPSQPQYSPHPQHQDPAFVAMQAQHYQYPRSSSSSSSPPRLAFAPIYHQNGHAQGGIGGQIGAQYPSSISSNDNHLTPEEAELKRIRNTAASARFRAKKKRREQSLERSAREKKEKLSALEKRIRDLEAENAWLKDLIMERKDNRERKEEDEEEESRVEREEGEERTGRQKKRGIGTGC